MLKVINKFSLYSANSIKTTRFVSILSQKCQCKDTTIQRTDFKPIYNLPQIRLLAIINKLKLHCTVLTAISLPSAVILNHLDFISFDEVIFITILGLAASVPFYGLGFLTHRLVGVAYYNEEEQLTKISFINFWGRRENIEIPINDIIPFGDASAVYTDSLYLKIRRHSNAKYLKISTRFGVVLDNEGFCKVFAQ